MALDSSWKERGWLASFSHYKSQIQVVMSCNGVRVSVRFLQWLRVGPCIVFLEMTAVRVAVFEAREQVCLLARQLRACFLSVFSRRRSDVY